MEGLIDFSDWEKIDLRVAEIIEVEEIPNVDKLWKLTVDLGFEIGKKIICAGIKQNYSKKELIGKKIIVFVNLKPRTMKGIVSEGMLLAAVSEDHSQIRLIKPDKDIELGSRVS